MAKISAYGETEYARWVEPRTGSTLVLTIRPDGRPSRLLYKIGQGRYFLLAAQLEGMDGVVGAVAYIERRFGPEHVRI